jgi:hypothetical protein
MDLIAPPPPKGVAVAMRFDFEGRHYGLAVPIVEGLNHEDGEAVPTIVLTDREVAIVIKMLQDLRWSARETLRQLEAGEMYK